MPEFFQWLKLRCESMTGFFAEVARELRKIRPGVDLRLNAYISERQELSGLNLKALKPHLGSIRSSDYTEQAGDPSRMEFKRRWLLSVRRAVGDGMHFLSAIGIRPRATKELIRQGVAISARCGADGLSLGHYDGAPLSHLDAIREGLEEAEVTLG
jgi:hypothetical protein